jgi:SAM-dependent methyltransferase
VSSASSWSLGSIREAWDPRADRYLALFRDELDGKPFDQGAFEAFAARLDGKGLVADVGCGPCGHVAALLTRLGLQTISVDLSPRCIELSRAEQPHLRFEVMDLASLQLGDESLDGLVAYYALYDQPKTRLGATFREFARVVRPGGQLLAVAKEGTNEGQIDDPLGSGLKVYWASLTGAELRSAAEQAGFHVDGCHVREPLPGEIASRRIYLTASRP